MRKKVLFLITKSNFGGAQRYVHDLAVGLPPEDFEMVVALGGNGPLAEKLREQNVRVITIPSLQRDISLAKEWLAFGEIARIVHQERPDVLHINSSKAGAIGTLIGRIYRVPKVVFTGHGWAFNEERPLWQRVVIKCIHWLTVLFSHVTIAVSREAKRQMNWPFAQKKIVVIHNGRAINLLQKREVARAYLIEREPRLSSYLPDFWSLTIAELHPVKRHNAVIEAMKDVVILEPNTRHLIIGAGDQEEYLHKRISELGLQEHVFLLGNIPDASQYLKAADLFILPSRSEAMPYAIIEACIAGRAIVASNVGGISEVIDHGTSGLLVPPQDKKALFKAILQLRTDATLRDKLATGALSRAQDFTPEKMIQATVDLYHST